MWEPGQDRESHFHQIAPGRQAAWLRPACAGAPGREDRPAPATRRPGTLLRAPPCPAGIGGAPGVPAPAWPPGPSSAGRRPIAGRPPHPAAARPADPARPSRPAPGRSPSTATGAIRPQLPSPLPPGSARGAAVAHLQSKGARSPASPWEYRSNRRGGPAFSTRPASRPGTRHGDVEARGAGDRAVPSPPVTTQPR